jgi:hypothetical protein
METRTDAWRLDPAAMADGTTLLRRTTLTD